MLRVDALMIVSLIVAEFEGNQYLLYDLYDNLEVPHLLQVVHFVEGEARHVLHDDV